MSGVVFILCLMVVAVYGRPVPYTPFEHSPFEGKQMEEIERLRLRGVSEKEIFARNAHPHPAVVPARKPSSQFLTFLSGLCPQARVMTERESSVVATVEETSTGDETEAKEAEKKVGVTKKVKVTQAKEKGLEQMREMQASVDSDQSKSEDTDKRHEREHLEQSHTVKKVLDNTERDGESAELVAAIKKVEKSKMED
ncbi:hypothetical protein MMC13_002615 [Lambiella insularis]|nr:hypothetical protein [Lambiella insularis]